MLRSQSELMKAEQNDIDGKTDEALIIYTLNNWQWSRPACTCTRSTLRKQSKAQEVNPRDKFKIGKQRDDDGDYNDDASVLNRFQLYY